VTVPDPATSANPLGSKPKKWAHGGEVPTVTLGDGKIAEAVVAIPYAADDSTGLLTPLTVDHASGALNVTGSGGGGGGAVTIADGADVTLGAKADDVWDTFSPVTVVGLLKFMATQLNTGIPVDGHLGIDANQGLAYSPYLANAITTTVTVSGVAGKFGGCALINLNSSPAYLQCFDTTGAVSLGTTPPTFVIPLPANSTAANGAADRFELTVGVILSNGLKVAATTTPTGASTVSTGLSGTIMYI
jgi:hypothetical protein